MADKRISQLTDRGTVANSDVVPIVVSGASTTNKATISSIQTFMQGNLDLGVTSVGLSMPSAFTVTGSPVTSSGNISVVGAGTVSQYIRGDGSLADFPQGGGGGGASVNYYLNGSVSQGTIGGIAYREMNKTPILGTGTDFVAIADGYLASFITDAGDPGLLEIPGGNWNFETYFSASSGGGTPTFYVELYKVNSGGTATLIASNSTTPELIAFGTTISPYFSTLAVPTTTLALTDRLALRYYVARSGRTITLHTENSHLCQIITTFTTGLTALNGLTAQVQNFATGTSGTDFAISSATNIHTFNLPDASATARGVVTTGTQTFAGYKIFNGTIGVNNDLQLVTVGTALNTFIKNINSTGLTSIGSNGFGFNNANNIYFSGSSKGGGVFAFSNTGTQTYTLQDASGTLAFTSDISTAVAGYLPLTGGTLSNNLFITGGGLQVSGSTSANRQVVELYTSGSVSRLAASYVGSSSYGNLELLTGGLARLAITSTGNIGIGTITPTDFGSTYKVVSIDGSGGGGVLDLMNTGVRTLTLAVDGGEASISSRVSGNPLIFKTNNAGTVATRLTIASTGAATFSSSVSVSDNFYVSGGSVGTNTGNGVHLNHSSNLAQVQLNATTGSFIDFSTSGTDFLGRIIYLNSDNLMRFHTNSNANASMVITSAGNVGIGTPSPASALTIASAGELRVYRSDNARYGSLYTDNLAVHLTSSNDPIRISSADRTEFYTAGSERMRITSGGALLIGTQGASNRKIQAVQTVNDFVIGANNSTASSDVYGYGIDFSGQSPNNSSSLFLYCADTTTIRCTIRANGGIANFSANDVNLSDERTKKDIEPLESYWDKFKAIEIVKFKYKDQTHDDFNIGVIAQQVESVAPEFVDVDGWDTKPELDEEGNEIVSEEEPLKSIYTADLNHATIKVLQEAMTKIEKLETEINSLKNQIK